MDIFDERCYEFHEGDSDNRCFLCGCNSVKFFVLRQIASMKMVHLCEGCMLRNLSEYYLDNTRPWIAKQGCRK